MFEHDGKGVTGFALYATPEKGGKGLRADLGLVLPDRKGVRSAPLPPLPAGIYSLSIAAYNAAGESPAVKASPDRIVVGNFTQSPVSSTRSSARPNEAKPSPSNAGKGGFFGRVWDLLIGADSKD
jgi:hypothetical protein